MSRILEMKSKVLKQEQKILMKIKNNIFHFQLIQLIFRNLKSYEK
jgi:hypothetical protein